MKYFFSLIFSLIIAGKSSASNDNEIIQLVNNWNEFHNTHITSGIFKLYAPEVLFYGRTVSASECYWSKEKFLIPGFSQEIVSTITVTHYKSGVIKADFTKRTKSDKKTKEHFSYLLFKYLNGQYLITGESDNLTDQRKNVQLNLGEIDDGSNNATPYVLLLIILIATAFYGWKKYRKQKEPLIFENNIVNKIKGDAEFETGEQKSSEPTSKQKGDAFENFVVERFDKSFFTLKEWRSDKFHNGRYAMSNLLPDLEYRFKKNNVECVFAVECKWRSSFKGGEIQWAKDHQLENYRKFSVERKINVFVVIGIGGTPEAPQSLYIVPLKEINSVFLYQPDLKKYYRSSKGDFFFDVDLPLLK